MIDGHLSPAKPREFPRLYSCPITKRLVGSLCDKTQAPEELILMAALMNNSILLQGLIDVERPLVGVGPVSLYGLIIAESGERKSSVAKLLERPVYEFNRIQRDKHRSECENYELELDIYKDEYKRLKKCLRKADESGDCTLTIRSQLSELNRNHPTKPILLQLIMEDATPEAMAFELFEGWGNVGLSSSEGGSILSGRAVSDLPMLNKLWSAETVTVTRKTSESYVLDNTRLSISLMAQGSAVEKYMMKNGEESHGIGFLARFLVCVPISNQGFRLIGRGYFDSEGYDNYIRVVDIILKKIGDSFEKKEINRQALRFSPEAARRWVECSNKIEVSMRPGGWFEYSKDHASKLAENIARIAALLTYVELGEEADISIGILRDAEDIAYYYSGMYIYAFGRRPRYERNMNLLREYFSVQRDGGVRYIKKNKVRQRGPNQIRNKSILDDALYRLQHAGEISLINCQNGMIVVDLYPSFPVDKDLWDFNINR